MIHESEIHESAMSLIRTSHAILWGGGMAPAIFRASLVLEFQVSVAFIHVRVTYSHCVVWGEVSYGVATVSRID